MNEVPVFEYRNHQNNYYALFEFSSNFLLSPPDVVTVRLMQTTKAK
jgi:hypothetical protein